jgi:hypothetical protein
VKEQNQTSTEAPLKKFNYDSKMDESSDYKHLLHRVSLFLLRERERESRYSTS